MIEMRQIKTTLILLYTIAAACPPLQAEGPERFFTKSDLTLSGSYYYPEHWPADQWERDISKMAELGFDFTHYGEFAWATLEPEEGHFEFGWLDEAVRLAEKHGLGVIMCTPTPTPPAWLTGSHPDVMCVGEDGQRIQHGARQQASWASDTYRGYVEKIVAELAKRYGNHPAVIGWQIDNEPSHYTFSYEYSDNNQEKFRQWLRSKYADINELNRAWGTAFWSLTYNDFDQIEIPNQLRLPGKTNPHAMLDFKRFTADMAADFVNFQCDVLRRYISPDQWVTTNTMPGHPQVDPSRMDHLDFLTYTRYLVNGRYQGHGELGFRISDPELLGWNNDFYRNIKGVSGVMEVQPGQINHGNFNPQTHPGAVRLWYYHIFAGGNNLVCHYRFRQPLFGREQYHYGMMQTDGVSVSRTGAEIAQFNEEMEVLRKAYDPEAQRPERLEKLRTAILINPDNRWEMDTQPQTEQWNTFKHYNKIYSSLKSLGVPVDIVEENTDFSEWPVIVAPAYQLLDRELIARWQAYVEQGGHLVLTCRTGQKDRRAHMWENKLAEPVYGLIGARELYYDHLPADQWATATMDRKKYRWNNWADVVEPDGTSEVWAAYSDQFYAGSAAVLNKCIGKGQVTYIGIDSDDGEMEKAVMRKVYKDKGEVFDLPPGIVLEWRDGFWVGLNYTSKPWVFPVRKGARIIIGTPKVPVAGVVVWKD